MFKIHKHNIGKECVHNIEYGLCNIITTKNGTFEAITWKNHYQGQRNFMSLRAAKHFGLYCIMKIRRST